MSADATLTGPRGNVLSLNPSDSLLAAATCTTWARCAGTTESKGYYEFAASNRADGWNAWLTLLIPLSPAKQ